MFKLFKNSFPFQSTSETKPKPRFTYGCTRVLDNRGVSSEAPLGSEVGYIFTTCAQNEPVVDLSVPMKVVETDTIIYDRSGVIHHQQTATVIHTERAAWKFEVNQFSDNNLTQKVEDKVYNGDKLNLTIVNRHREALKFWDKHANPLPSVENKSMHDGIDSFFGNGDCFQRSPEELFANLGGFCTSGCRTKMKV